MMRVCGILKYGVIDSSIDIEIITKASFCKQMLAKFSLHQHRNFKHFKIYSRIYVNQNIFDKLVL
jgi:hypothetical protein